MYTQHRFAFAFVVGLLLPFAAPAVEAQPDTATVTPGTPPHRAFCWRPRPAARCGGYLVTEVGLEWPVVASRDGEDVRITGTLGPMINRGPDAAWGVLASISSESHARAEARHRKWLGGTRGLDLGAGVAYRAVARPFGGKDQLYGLTGSAGIEQGVFGLTTRADLLQGGGETEVAFYGGVRVGGYVGPTTAVVVFVGFLGLLAIAYAGS